MEPASNGWIAKLASITMEGVRVCYNAAALSGEFTMSDERIDERIKWLDEQRRLSAESITRLTEQLSAIGENLARQDRQLGDLSSETTRLATLSARIKEFDDILAQHRIDIARHLEQSEDRRTEKEAQLEDLRRRDHDGLSKRISEIENQIIHLQEMQQALETRKEEELRINRKLDSVEKEMAVALLVWRKVESRMAGEWLIFNPRRPTFGKESIRYVVNWIQLKIEYDGLIFKWLSYWLARTSAEKLKRCGLNSKA
jgi:hypothetical protein